MRIYDEKEEKIVEIRCNCCGKSIERIEKTELYTDYLHVEKKWNYFSTKDLEKHYFDICEMCYDKWQKSFVLPVETSPTIELFEGIEEE